MNAGSGSQILGGLATISRGFGASVVSHYDSQPVIDIFGAVQGRDLGAVAKDINEIIASYDGKLPKGTRIVRADRCRRWKRRTRA